jgi:hypothetical protein
MKISSLAIEDSMYGFQGVKSMREFLDMPRVNDTC